MKKKIGVLLVLVFLVWLDWYIRAPDSRSRELTHAIEAQASEQLRNYPYKFRVLKVSGTTAYLSTPRNVDVPAFRALGALFPTIDTKDNNNPEFIAVERQLAAVQSEARALLLTQPGVKEVRWELDRDWLAAHQIALPSSR